MALTDDQIFTLYSLGKTTSVLSIIGSVWVICMVLRNSKKREMAYHRAMLALSTTDFIFSVAWFVMGSPAPESGGCTAVAFFILLTSTPQAMYNASICVYYLLVVGYSWSEEQVHRLQPLMIIFPVLWGLLTAILFSSMGMINPVEYRGFCYIYPYPTGCSGSECTPYHENVYNGMRFGLVEIPKWISFGVGLISMGIIYYTVAKNEREHNDTTGKATFGMLWFVQAEDGQDSSGHIRSRRLARQACWYLVNFFLTYVFVTADAIIIAFGGSPPFALLCLLVIFRPWQGFWNAIIYIHPRYSRNKEKYPDMSFWQRLTTSDEQDHRLGARNMRSTVAGPGHSFLGSFFGKKPASSGLNDQDNNAMENESAAVMELGSGGGEEKQDEE